MNILVLLAGVADNRYPLHDIQITDRLISETGQSRRILSPFDEGALELALKLRDSNERCQIDVLVLSGPNNDNLMRSVAAFKPDTLRLLELSPACPWDAQLSSAQIAHLLTQQALKPDLLLIGREFGDMDEGSLPVMLAARLDTPLFSLTQYAQWRGEQLYLLRERGSVQQWLGVTGPVVATVTNDKRNKLRHPLMKNVMLAKKMSFDSLPASAQDNSALQPVELCPAREIQRGGRCLMVEGDVSTQAATVLTYLRDHWEGRA